MSRMQRLDWVARLVGHSRPQRLKNPERRRHHRRLEAEPLEDRRMLATFVVMNNADSGADSLRDAIASANGAAGADEITFDGSLSGQTISLTTGELEITEALVITGLGQHDLTVSGNNASRIFNITATAGDFTIAGLTITGGRTTGDNANFLDNTFSGGAIRSVTVSNLTIDQSTISGNSTSGLSADGGGLFSVGTVTLTQSTVSGNSTLGISADGGGIYVDNGDLTLDQSIISGNSTLGISADGGGLFSVGTVTLTQSSVSGNSTSGISADGGGIGAVGFVMLIESTVSGNSTGGDQANGGGIFAFGAVALTDSTVSDNSTGGEFSDGGGIASGGAVTLINSTVSGNSTTDQSADGGGISAAAVTLIDSTISGNSTAGDNARGGGVWARDVMITDSTVSGNSTSGSGAAGGGLWVGDAVTLTRSTVTDNHATHASAFVGGVGSFDDPNAPIVITGSIVAGNTAGGGIGDLLTGVRLPGTGALTVEYSLIGDNAGTGLAEAPAADAFGNLIGDAFGGGVIDPLLGPLGDNGGPTETHALLIGSPAIDAGDPVILFDPDDFDQRGAPFVRVLDGDDVDGARIDMGAFERHGFVPPAASVVAVVRNRGTDVDNSAQGEVSTLPSNETWIDEWESFYVEIWVSTPDTDDAGVASAQVDLTYNTDFFTANPTIEFGPAFTVDQTSNVDDAAGRITIAVATPLTDAGDDSHVLLARVHFEATENDLGVPIELTEPGPVAPVDDVWIELVNDASLVVELVDVGPVIVEIGPAPATELYPLMYDLDDDGRISFSDLAEFASVFLSDVNVVPRAAKSDFDVSGRVNFTDFAFLAVNFLKNRDTGSSIVYPSNFPDDFGSQALVVDAAGSGQAAASPLTNDEAAVIISEVSARLGASADAVTVEVVDLPGDFLGRSSAGTIQLDVDAAGYGWFVDRTPSDDLEFSIEISPTEFAASADSEAARRVDLLTVVMHELGHVLGYHHNSESTVMDSSLRLGTRRLADDDADSDHDEYTLETGLVDDFFAALALL